MKTRALASMTGIFFEGLKDENQGGANWWRSSHVSQMRRDMGHPTRFNLVFPAESGQVETIEVHDFVPHSHEVLHKRLLRIITGINFGDCPEL